MVCESGEIAVSGREKVGWMCGGTTPSEYDFHDWDADETDHPNIEHPSWCHCDECEIDRKNYYEPGGIGWAEGDWVD